MKSFGIEFLANAPDFNIGHGRDSGHETEKHDQESHRDLSSFVSTSDDLIIERKSGQGRFPMWFPPHSRRAAAFHHRLQSVVEIRDVFLLIVQGYDDGISRHKT